MAKTKFSIEAAFTELEQILARMEDPEMSLSDSMDLYKKGVRLLEKCSQTLDRTEKEIQILQEGQERQDGAADEGNTPGENSPGENTPGENSEG